ncbi:hypothetical protein CPB84DRAFT_1462937 [Gymnopilus junonius]|uniref:Uncharacterized protein n=1 Tax=Gymnopilus junonius TaxID=109634 RepID=A0A9P5NHU1_GYMJU|nr:hypothetical protein CPB84DRAFT_1462937 [Gymnopilus junonius]
MEKKMIKCLNTSLPNSDDSSTTGDETGDIPEDVHYSLQKLIKDLAFPAMTYISRYAGAHTLKKLEDHTQDKMIEMLSEHGLNTKLLGTVAITKSAWRKKMSAITGQELQGAVKRKHRHSDVRITVPEEPKQRSRSQGQRQQEGETKSYEFIDDKAEEDNNKQEDQLEADQDQEMVDQRKSYQFRARRQKQVLGRR